ncbi:MAG: helix-turn-helix transcriptional regulator [Bifidobacteriaceae bacterium]|nr:helix-turn-helix transcriptional regulator [Bifidobacteriaceae bacterium]
MAGIPEPRNRWSAQWSKRIGKNIQDTRRGKHLTAQQLSEHLARIGYPIAPTTLAGLEQGQRGRVSVQELHAIAYALDVPATDLMYGTNPDEPMTHPDGAKTDGTRARLSDLGQWWLDALTEAATEATALGDIEDQASMLDKHGLKPIWDPELTANQATAAIEQAGLDPLASPGQHLLAMLVTLPRTMGRLIEARQRLDASNVPLTRLTAKQRGWIAEYSAKLGPN